MECGISYCALVHWYYPIITIHWKWKCVWGIFNWHSTNRTPKLNCRLHNICWCVNGYLNGRENEGESRTMTLPIYTYSSKESAHSGNTSLVGSVVVDPHFCKHTKVNERCRLSIALLIQDLQRTTWAAVSFLAMLESELVHNLLYTYNRFFCHVLLSFRPRIRKSADMKNRTK